LNRVKLYNAISYFTVFVCLLSVSFVFLFSHDLRAQPQELEAVFFDSNTNSISEESIEVLNQKANSLRNIPEFRITLEGYSDITGKADYNLNLSEKRARLVKDYLVDIGLNPNYIKIVGKGGTEKYGVGETNEALQQNRRVNLIVDIPTEPAVVEENIETEELSQNEQTESTQEQIVKSTSTELSDEKVLTPVQPILEDLSKSMAKKVRQNASNGIIFTTPREMQIGQTYTVEAEVSYSFIEALSKDSPNLSLENQVGINLSGSGFKISQELENDPDISDDLLNDSKVRHIAKDNPSRWAWFVEPQRDGIRSIVLSVIINSEDPAINGEYDTFQRVIDVQPNLIHSITSSYGIMGLLIVLIISVVAWILISKVRLN